MNMLNRLKIFLSRKPKVTFTYEVNGKIKKATMINEGDAGLSFFFENPQARIFPINEDFFPILAKQFPKRTQLVNQIRNALKSLNDLSLIENDLHKAQEFIRSFKKRARSKGSDAYIVAAIITYMKAFTSSTNRTQLTDKIIPEELKEHHSIVKDLRDKFISHADLPAKYESGQNFILYDENELIILEPISFKIRLQQAEDSLQLLTSYILKYVEGQSNKKRAEAQRHLNRLRPKRPL